MKIKLQGNSWSPGEVALLDVQTSLMAMPEETEVQLEFRPVWGWRMAKREVRVGERQAPVAAEELRGAVAK